MAAGPTATARLRASSPSAIARDFESCRTRSSIFFEVDQGGDFVAFTVTLHNTTTQDRAGTPGTIQLLFRGSILQLWAQTGGNMKAEQVDLNSAVRGPGELGSTFRANKKGPIQYRIFEDHPGGRLAVFVDGRKAAEWAIGKGKPGGNRGGFSFQPMTWNAGVRAGARQNPGQPLGRSSSRKRARRRGCLENRPASLGGGEVKDGRLESLSADNVRLETSNGLIDLPREKVSLLRLRRPENPPDEDRADRSCPPGSARRVRRGGIAFQKGQICDPHQFRRRTRPARERVAGSGIPSSPLAHAESDGPPDF